MQLIVEEIIEDEVSQSVSLRLRRPLNVLDKFYNIKEFFRKKNRPSYKHGRTCYQVVDQTYLDIHEVKVGDDINSFEDMKYAMILLESTDQSVFDNEGLAYNAKMNPSTMQPILYNNKPVYHATFLIPASEYEGDILL